jgi:tetratricopeptide (TPR) repeat protein
MRTLFLFLLSWIFWSSPPSVLADQDHPKLPKLFAQLELAETSVQSQLLVQEIWSAWMEHANSVFTKQMQRGIDAMSAGDLQRAEAAFSQLVNIAPDWAEAWNKRATVRYYLGDLEGSANDIAETLAREPRHFGALSGLGMIQVRQEKFIEALQTYERLQQIHPQAQDAQRLIPNLRQQAAQQML